MKIDLFIILVVMFSSLSSCSKQADPRTIYGIDPEFAIFVEKFEEAYGRDIGDMPMGFVDQKDDVVGRCRVFYGKKEFSQIEIDRGYWNDPSTGYKNKLNLIFHELGHCVLGLKHTEERVQYEKQGMTFLVPKSFMYPSVFFGEVVSETEEYYIEEILRR